MAELNLSRQIVSRRCLEKAIAAYHDLAAFHVTETLKGWSIVFSGCRYGEKRTIEEFEYDKDYQLGGKINE